MESGTEDAGIVCTCNPCRCDLPDGRCLCDPCYCDTPEQSPRESNASIRGEEEEPLPFVEVSNLGKGYTLDEFIRAKEYFMVTSTNTGLSVYDHLSEVIRKLLDERNPPNVVDFMEEISLNIKRYRFGFNKQAVRDAHYISPPVLSDSYLIVDSWKKHALWSAEQADGGEDKPSFGGFPNLMRFLYYLEQVNVGLPREEMFRAALAIRDLSMNPAVSRARFWGKVFGIYKNYYILEVEFKGDGPEDVWEAPPPTAPEMAEVLETIYVADDPAAQIPGAGITFQRAGFAVMDPEILTPYQQTSGLPPGATSIVAKPLPTDEMEFYGEGLTIEYDDPDAAAEIARWEQYQNELMTGFPVPPVEEIIEIPAEDKATGLNRRAFYVCNELGDAWVRLPDVTPQQINASRTVRWQLSGTLGNKLKTFPEYPGREGNYLRALLARITAGSQVSPRGYFKTTKYGKEDAGEDDDEDDVDEEEEEDTEGNDTVYPVKKFRPPPMSDLLSRTMDAWVHHASHILRQGRLTWWNPTKPKKEVDEDDDEEIVEEEEDEEDEENPEREIGPTLFSSLSDDKTLDGTAPWSARASSSVFTEFQVAAARSNLWPGATNICTVKGKVQSIYFGDGLKFFGKTYSPGVPEETQSEYIPGPELTEINDPTVEEEQAWLAKLQLDEIADIEDEFVDNEVVEEEPEDESDDD